MLSKEIYLALLEENDVFYESLLFDVFPDFYYYFMEDTLSVMSMNIEGTLYVKDDDIEGDYEEEAIDLLGHRALLPKRYMLVDSRDFIDALSFGASTF